jgi:hypothetical protein
MSRVGKSLVAIAAIVAVAVTTAQPPSPPSPYTKGQSRAHHKCGDFATRCEEILCTNVPGDGYASLSQAKVVAGTCIYQAGQTCQEYTVKCVTAKYVDEDCVGSPTYTLGAQQAGLCL